MISYKVQTLSPTCAFCVATLMFEQAQVAQPLPVNPFLSFNGNVGEPWALKYDSYRGFIKRTAKVWVTSDPLRFLAFYTIFVYLRAAIDLSFIKIIITI